MRVTTGVEAEGEGSDIGAFGLGRAAAGDSTAATTRSTVTRRIRDWIAAELTGQRSRGFLWLPVAFGLGAAAYLGLKTEPPLWSAAAVGAVAVVPWLAALQWARSSRVILAAGLLAAAAAGFFIAKAHSDAVAAPIAPQGMGVVHVEGWVVDIGPPSERGPRLLIAPTRIEGLAPAATPTRVRIVAPVPGGPESAPPPGSAVRLLTLLDPPPGPAAPGVYDFARDAWFEGVGGVGLALRPAEVTALPLPPAPLRLEMAVNALRWRVAGSIAGEITAALGPSGVPAAGLAAAVTTSHQDWLPAADRDNLRAAGLAHMLAIAGLHTAALTGFAFFAVRLLIAAWPWLALRVPGKKVAAVFALIVVAAYLVLSGAHPPARRAAITAAIAFLAILADRRAVSLHSLALAALLILFIEPDVVLAPGFEMSFCATASLVALAEIWPRRAQPKGLPWPLAAAQKARDGVIALMLVSLVAGAATSPFAIQHFNRVANYGVLANLTADFVASAVLMPALALGLLLQALGLAQAIGAPVFFVAGWAAIAVLRIAHIFAAAPGAAGGWPSAPEIALAVSYLGIVFACLWRGQLRWLGVVLGAAVAVWPRPTPPVAWIAADGDEAAVVDHGREILMKPTMRAYATQLWAQHRGFTLGASPEALAADSARAFDCDRKACAPVGSLRPAIAGWWYRKAPPVERLRSLCHRADMLVSRAELPPGVCPGVIVLGPGDFARGGAAEVFASPRGWRLAWAQGARGRRPWTVGDAQTR